MQKTKIIATIGPSCNNKQTIKAMLLKGLNVIRINMSHNPDIFVIKKTVKMIRTQAKQTKNRVSVGNTTYRERKKKLKTLLKTFLEMEDEALSALHKDMKKSKAEATITEIVGVKTEASFAIKNLRKWITVFQL